MKSFVTLVLLGLTCLPAFADCLIKDDHSRKVVTRVRGNTLYRGEYSFDILAERRNGKIMTVHPGIGWDTSTISVNQLYNEQWISVASYSDNFILKDGYTVAYGSEDCSEADMRLALASVYFFIPNYNSSVSYPASREEETKKEESSVRETPSYPPLFSKRAYPRED